MKVLLNSGEVKYSPTNKLVPRYQSGGQIPMYGGGATFIKLLDHIKPAQKWIAEVMPTVIEKVGKVTDSVKGFGENIGKYATSITDRFGEAKNAVKSVSVPKFNVYENIVKQGIKQNPKYRDGIARFNKAIKEATKSLEEGQDARQVASQHIKDVNSRLMSYGKARVNRNIKNTLVGTGLAAGAAGAAGAGGLYYNAFANNDTGVQPAVSKPQQLQKKNNTGVQPAVSKPQQLQKKNNTGYSYNNGQLSRFNSLTGKQEVFDPNSLYNQGYIQHRNGSISDASGKLISKATGSKDVFVDNAQRYGFKSSEEVANAQQAMVNAGILNPNDVDGLWGQKSMRAYEIFKQLGGKRVNNQFTGPQIQEVNYEYVPYSRNGSKLIARR